MTQWLDDLRTDARHAGRQLLAAPAFALLSLVSLSASCIPARRASRIDPMLALRQE